MMNLAVVIMAAGKGTRMKSLLPKVLHRLGGKSMVDYGVDLALRLSPDPPVLIVGHGAEQVQNMVGDRALYVKQVQQLGTGHAVLQAEAVLRHDVDFVLVYAADMPLLTTETMREVVAMHGQHPGPVTMLTVIADDPRGFGRIVRGAEGEVLSVVEEVEATPEQKAISELNTGIYCFDVRWLWPALKRIKPSPQKGEYYLTDTIELAVADGYRVAAVTTKDEAEVMGVNTRVHLSEAEQVLRQRVNTAMMMAGVTMIDPAATYIEPDVTAGRDTVLWPGVCLFGKTRVGAGCEIEAGAVLRDVELGDGCRVGAGTVLQGIVVPAGTVIPPGTVEAADAE